jgi:membrane protease YdiL (CAAX protease family)
VLPYVWLSLAIVSLWLPPHIALGRAATAGPLPLRHAASATWLILAVGHAYTTGVVTPAGVLAIVAFGLLLYRCSRDRQALTTIAVVVFALALMAHVVPGFANFLVVKDAVLSPGAVPYTLYLNFDKAQIGLFLLAFGPPLLSSRAEWAAMLRGTLPRVLVLIAVLMACALWVGQVRIDIKWPEIFPIWAWSNLLFTCTAEETLFRGVIQRRLQGELLPDQAAPARDFGAASGRAIAGLAIASLVFGLAHYAGGVWAVVLATIAGVGYGWIFWRTNRIEAPILAHFLVNTTHVLFFTYPARV